MNKCIVLFIISFFCTPVFAIDLDYTVDDAIRKNYHLDQPIKQGTIVKPAPQKTAEPLPKLPAVPKSVETEVNKTNTAINKIPKQVRNDKFFSHKALPIRKGMSFDIANANAISDRQKTGTNIIFTNPKPIKTAYYTIPQGTRFVGKIIESHQPQLTGNGGLVSISVNTIILGGNYQNINTIITKVGGKHVFFGNIKGKRSYLENAVGKGKWGRKTFHKMNRVSSSLAKDKTTVVMAPFTFAYGTVLGAVSTATSPVVSIFCKGKHLNIPVNTTFRIKFNQDVKLYY